MTVYAGDLQLHHVGGLISAALNAVTAGLCAKVYECDLRYGTPRTLMPCLEIYRESETFGGTGTGAKRDRHVDVALNYYIPQSVKGEHYLASAMLATIAGYIDNVVERMQLDTYPTSAQITAESLTCNTGDGLEDICGVYDLRVTSCAYEPSENDEWPMLRIKLGMKYYYTRGVEIEDLELIRGVLELDGVNNWDITSTEADFSSP